jgi:hypothetical protein
MLTASVIFLSHCASKKEEAKTAEAPKTEAAPNWNYDKIRQVREDEKSSTPVEAPYTPEAKLADDCKIMSDAARKQSKISGCKKLDPRLGYGENSYCCPRSDLK